MASPQTASTGVQYLSPNDVQPILRKLVKTVREELMNGLTIDGFVVVARGGLGVGVVFCEAFPDIPVEFFVCRKYYGEKFAREDGKLVVESYPNAENIRGKSLAVIDDVRQNGETLSTVTKWIEDHGGAVSCCVVLVLKNSCKLKEEKLRELEASIKSKLIFGTWYPLEDYVFLPWEPSILDNS